MTHTTQLGANFVPTRTGRRTPSRTRASPPLLTSWQSSPACLGTVSPACSRPAFGSSLGCVNRREARQGLLSPNAARHHQSVARRSHAPRRTSRPRKPYLFTTSNGEMAMVDKNPAASDARMWPATHTTREHSRVLAPPWLDGNKTAHNNTHTRRTTHT